MLSLAHQEPVLIFRKGGLSMKRLMRHSGKMLATLALMTATFSANTACNFIFHQPKAPAGLKQLRKF